MALEILHDRRIRSIPWLDLVRLARWEAIKELILPIPALALSLFLAYQGLYVPALVASFVFFLTGLRLAHGAFHYTLGLARPSTDLVMAGPSVLMLGSMHCMQFHHLRHHIACLKRTWRP
jgi:hypothetical protein